MSDKRVIGIDASTTTVGIAILEYSVDGYCHYDGYHNVFEKLIHYEYYKPNKKLDILDMVIETREYILGVARKFKVDEFVIEDYVRFMANNSTAATTIPLAILNMSLRLAVLDNLEITPHALNVMKIRHTLKLDKKLPAKEDIPELVALRLGISFPWEMKINKRTKKQEPKTESYDMADAMAVALAWLRIQSRPVVKKTRGKK
jgi:Holliday junction resolvasome RuvABC endonuclease subunit